ncbi:MAG: hypothetical protein M1818_007595 [Claussenomyces sp. TS43310]|nr:MAG: hypothetical protein M1818_007595 [Claussenomyces sp. TS43310]
MATTVASYPPGGTWLDTIPRSFTDVKVDADKANAIDTTQFLEAAESLATMFGMDIPGFCSLVPFFLTWGVQFRCAGFHGFWARQERYTGECKAPMESETLQSLVVNELKTKKHTATEGLVWLVRALEFTALGFSHNINNAAEELSNSFRTAYGTTLKPHHSFMVKPIFSAAMSACPYRKDFYAKLGDDLAKVESALRLWLKALTEQVAILKGFLDRKEAKW